MDILKLQAIYKAQSQSNAKSDIKETLKEYSRYIQLAVRAINNTQKIVATIYTMDGDKLSKKQDGALIEFNKLVNNETVETDYYSYGDDIKKLVEALKAQKVEAETEAETEAEAETVETVETVETEAKKR